MLVEYNKLSRVDKPLMTLCNPGSVYTEMTRTDGAIIGPLCDTEAEEIIFNFNAPSELNFRTYLISTGDSEVDLRRNDVFNAILNRRLIYVEKIGYFSITSVKYGYSEGVYYKDVTAESAEIELQQKGIPSVEDGTYYLTTRGTTKGILNMVADVLAPLWTVYHVDDSLREKMRTFEDTDPTLDCLTFLTENIQNAFECIVLFDPKNRRINVYDQAEYLNETPIQISVYDFINIMDISENADELHTALNVRGSDDTGISSVNPLGTNIIYNFDYYLPWMSESLRVAVNAWKAAVAAQTTQYIANNRAYYQALTDKSNAQADIDRYTLVLQLYKRLRDNVVADGDASHLNSYNNAISQNGGTPIPWGTVQEIKNAIDSEIQAYEGYLSTAQATYHQAETREASLWSEIARDNQRFGFGLQSDYFTQTQVQELRNYMFEGSYTDEYVTITEDMSYDDQFEQMKTLYDRGMQQLNRVSQPDSEYTVDSESGIFSEKFAQWSEYLETGCLVDIVYRKNARFDEVASLFLSSITVNYDEQEMSLKFSGRMNRSDPRALFEKVLGKINKSANSVNFINNAIAPVKEGEFDEMREQIQGSRDITMQNAFKSENEEIVIDGSGITGKKFKNDGTGEYEPQQIKLNSQNIIFTDDNWQSAKTAIGKLEWEGQPVYGINAEAIIGDVLIGENVFLKNHDNSVLFNDNGLTVKNSNNAIRIFPGDNGDNLMEITDNTDPANPKLLVGLTNSGSLYLNPEAIQIAWNNGAETIRVEEVGGRAQLNIYQSYTNAHNYQLLTSFDQDGTHFYNPNTNDHIASMGYNTVTNHPELYGLGFFLDDSSSFIQWSYQDPNDGQYKEKLGYYPKYILPGGGWQYQQGFHFKDSVYIHPDVGVHFYSDLNMHNNEIIDAVIAGSSDIRLKENIEPYKDCALDIVDSIGINSFDWKETGAHENIGFVAQQLQKVIPDAVLEDGKTGRLYVKPMQLIPYLVGAVQELYKLIKEEKE